MTNKLLLPLFALLLLAGMLPDRIHAFGMEPAISASASPSTESVSAGSEVTVMVTIKVDSGYHIYAIEQPDWGGKRGPTPTEIRLKEDSKGYLTPTSAWQEPERTIKMDPAFDIEVAYIYGSPLEFKRVFQVNPEIEPGSYTVNLEVFHQACTETSCLVPMAVDVSFELQITEAKESVEPATAYTEDSSSESEGTQPVEGEKAKDEAKTTAAGAVTSASGQVVRSSSFSLFLLKSFLLGLLALATPCVFPMIPITISFFANKSGGSTLGSARYAFVYVLSIIAGFTIIGFGLSVILYMVGAGAESSGFANIIASNPWINLFFAALYIGFALTLFEVFEIQLPGSLSNKLNQQAGSSGEYMGIALKALVFVVISFTCTAPLLGVLIVEALGGSWTRPLFGMIAFSAGFALPFFFLALLPQLMNRMPKAGNWLYSVKVVMGLVVLAAAFKFLSNADLVWLRENMILTREVLLAVWAAIALVCALYLFKLIRLSNEEVEDKGLGVTRLMLATLFATLTLYLSAGLFGGKVHTWVEAYLPPDLSPGGGSSMVASADGTDQLYWHKDIEPAIEQARAEGKNIFVDFTGYTCTNCRLMEKSMFPRPEVQELFQEYVLVKLYTDDLEKAEDGKTYGAKRQAYQAALVNTVALPYYVVMTPDEEVLATEEYTTNVERYVDFLSSGLSENGDRKVAQLP